VEQIKQAVSALSSIDITPLRDGWKYRDHWLGMLITVILLSLGAPFWFEMLRNILRLGDIFDPDTKTGWRR
jgi:hypothetical protein